MDLHSFFPLQITPKFKMFSSFVKVFSSGIAVMGRRSHTGQAPSLIKRFLFGLVLQLSAMYPNWNQMI